jgi:hypothetical protein
VSYDWELPELLFIIFHAALTLFEEAAIWL